MERAVAEERRAPAQVVAMDRRRQRLRGAPGEGHPRRVADHGVEAPAREDVGEGQRPVEEARARGDRPRSLDAGEARVAGRSRRQVRGERGRARHLGGVLVGPEPQRGPRVEGPRLRVARGGVEVGEREAFARRLAAAVRRGPLHGVRVRVEILAPRAEEAVAALEPLAEEIAHRPAPAREHPQREARELDRDWILVDAAEAALGDRAAQGLDDAGVDAALIVERAIDAEVEGMQEAIAEKSSRLEQERARAHRWIADGDGEDGLAGAGLVEVRRERGGDDLRGERGRRVVRAGSTARGGRADDPRRRADRLRRARREAAGEGAEEPRDRRRRGERAAPPRRERRQREGLGARHALLGRTGEERVEIDERVIGPERDGAPRGARHADPEERLVDPAQPLDRQRLVGDALALDRREAAQHPPGRRVGDRRVEERIGVGIEEPASSRRHRRPEEPPGDRLDLAPRLRPCRELARRRALEAVGHRPQRGRRREAARLGVEDEAEAEDRRDEALGEERRIDAVEGDPRRDEAGEEIRERDGGLLGERRVFGDAHSAERSLRDSR